MSGMTQAEVKKIITDSRIVAMDVTVNDSITARFGIDTGADRLYLSKTFADEYGIKYIPARGQRYIQTSFGAAEPNDAILSKLQITDEIELHNLDVTVIDFTQITRDTANKLVGLIGNQILKEYFVTIDYNDEWINISHDRPRNLNTANSIEIPFTWYQDHIIVTVNLSDVMSFPMVFDFCASHTAISKEAGELIGIAEEDRRVYLNSINLSGLVKNEKVITRVMDLSPLKRRMSNAGIEGVLGMTFLKDFKITIDYNSQLIYFQR